MRLAPKVLKGQNCMCITRTVLYTPAVTLSPSVASFSFEFEAKMAALTDQFRVARHQYVSTQCITTCQ